MLERMRVLMKAQLETGLQVWSLVNEPSRDRNYYNGYWNQVIFVRDTLAGVITQLMGLEELITAEVVATHTSKSVKLPVYEFVLESLGVTLLMRDNFHGWVVSVESESDLDYDFMGLFDSKEELSWQHCDGFPRDRVHRSYENDSKRFTCSFYDYHKLYSFIWILMYNLKS